jgi:DegV family protein with EDD domain
MIRVLLLQQILLRGFIMSYKIITDTCCDFPAQMYQQLDLTVVNLAVRFQEKEFFSYDDAWLKNFYDGLRAGEVATTSAVNPDGWAQAIESVLAGGDDALVLSFSSGLSTTYQSAVIAASDLQEKYPQRTVRVVDTLAASMGQGLLVYYACKQRDAGMTLDQLADWCLENRNHLCHWFTVDDLMYLKRGGRVSAATALVGTMLQIKPVLHVDDEGHLVNVSKARGRKASIDALAKKVGDTGIPGANDVCFISHGDCIDDANYLANILKEKYGVKEVVISYVGAVIGSHSGPGTLALFFLGEKK